MSDTHDAVLRFIDKISHRGEYEQVIEIFSCGACYWFAWMLHGRFPQSQIVYDEVINHFGCEVEGRIYDITGEVTNNYNWEPWQEVFARDTLHGQRIVRDCVMMRDDLC